MFDVQESDLGNFTVSSFGQAKTIDLGFSLALAREQHSGLRVLCEGIASDAAIDREINKLIADLERVRGEAKQLLASLNPKSASPRR